MLSGWRNFSGAAEQQLGEGKLETPAAGDAQLGGVPK